MGVEGSGATCFDYDLFGFMVVDDALSAVADLDKMFAKSLHE